VIIGSERGPVIAVWDRHGALQHAFAIAREGRVNAPAAALSVFELRAIRDWTEVGATPTDITHEAVSGNLMISLAERPSSLEILLGADRPLEPFLPGRKTPLSVDRVEAREDFDARLRASRYAYRLVVSRPEEILNLSLGGVPGIAFARAAGGRAKVRAIDLSTHLEAIDDVSKRLHIARDHQQALVARGWSSVQVDRSGPFRRMVMEEAELLLPVTFDATRLTVQLRGRFRASTVSLSLDGRDLGGKTLDAGWQQLQWDVPPGTWRSPVTSLVIHAPPGTELADVVIAREASVPARQ
jgi:hypothetical protein